MAIRRKKSMEDIAAQQHRISDAIISRLNAKPSSEEADKLYNRADKALNRASSYANNIRLAAERNDGGIIIGKKYPRSVYMGLNAG